MSSIQSMQRSMGFVSPSLRAANCGNCARLETSPNGLRCAKGAFYVRANSACDEHTLAAAETAKLQIGPTDV